MILIQWPSRVNSKFYEFTKKPVDNVTKIEFLSGRSVGFQTNTRKAFAINCALRVDKGELASFWDFYSNLGGTAGAFTCAALGDKYYRFAEIPSVENISSDYRKLSLNIEDVY